MNELKDAYKRYRRRWGWSGWQAGYLRMYRGRFAHLPRWMDDVQFLAEHLIAWRRGVCLTCGMREHHKMDCYNRVAPKETVRDDLVRLHLWKRARDM